MVKLVPQNLQSLIVDIQRVFLRQIQELQKSTAGRQAEMKSLERDWDKAVQARDRLENDAQFLSMLDLEQIDLDEAKKTAKKNATPTPIPYEVPEGAELTYRAYMHGKGWDKEYTKQGMVCGKPGKGLSIEALEIGINSDIEGKVCCNSDGHGCHE